MNWDRHHYRETYARMQRIDWRGALWVLGWLLVLALLKLSEGQ